ncbi:MAG TPA: cyclic nucleotide-binding domain-containing protein, partial [Nitrospira sp.]|nr:cyclic nucleotide-binding domain-containing protein [Nitrospira sp.]
MVRIRTAFNLDAFLNRAGKKADKGMRMFTFPKKQMLFSQGDTTDAMFYIQAGRVKLTVVSEQGKEAVVAILERGAFCGESCL